MQSTYWSRKKQGLETEIVQGSQFLSWSFNTRIGKLFLKYLFSTRIFSRIFYGWTTDAGWSIRSIEPFIQKFKISMNDFESQKYKSFNDFFTRKFKIGARSFVSSPKKLPAFAEGKYLGYSACTLEQPFSIKGSTLTLSGILGNTEKAALFQGGPVLICRLRPDDYHRFHFPDDGFWIEHYRIPGPLHATNPVSYRYKNDVLMTNERQVSLLETKNFGLLAYVEVGAMCVGRIKQTHPDRSDFLRGDEKGYFLVGGSTVILIGQSGQWQPDSDILTQTSSGIETHVLLGDSVADLLR